MGLIWVIAFPAFLHILNAYNGRNRGITTPRTPSHTKQYIKKPVKPVKSNREDYKKDRIKIELDELHKKEHTITHAPIKPHKISPQVKPMIRATPVTYTPQDSRKPAVTLARPWVNPCCILPMKAKPAQVEMQSKNKLISAPTPAVSKPAKFKKARKPRAPSFEKLTHEDMSDLKAHLSADIFKRLNYFELAHLKTAATRRGIDDWISLIDSKLSYEENRANLTAQYGAQESDSDLMQKYKNYQDMAQDEYRNT